MGRCSPNYEGTWHGSSCAFCFALGLSYRTLEAAVSVLPPTQRNLSHVMKLAVGHSAPDHDDEAQNHTALIAEMRTEIANLKKRTAEQASGAFQSGLPVPPCRWYARTAAVVSTRRWFGTLHTAAAEWPP